jgi:methylase of polypeptide subunit release factors
MLEILNRYRDDIRDKAYTQLQETGLQNSYREETIIAQATYAFILRLLLYNLIQHRYNLPSLNSAKQHQIPTLLQKASEASEIIALKPSPVDVFLTRKIADIGDVLKDLSAMANKERFKILNFYEKLISQEERRRFGEFYTPQPIAEFMARWAIRTPRDRVLDLGVGSGNLLLQAFNQLIRFKVPPVQAVTQLYGVDVNPSAALMTTINFAKVSEAAPTVILADFLQLSNLTAAKAGLPLGSFDVVLCNPPYTRHHELRPDYKRKLVQMIKKEYDITMSSLAGVYIYFLMHSRRFLRKGGRMAFIMPSGWLEAEYGKALREFFQRYMHVDAIILFEEDSWLFSQILTRPTITLSSLDSPNRKTLLVKLKQWPTINELISTIEKCSEGIFTWGRAHTVDLLTIQPENNWHILFKLTTSIKGSSKLIELGEIASVSRGIATGANNFFALNEKDVLRWKIERQFLKPVIIGTRHIKHYNFTVDDWAELRSSNKKVWLLWCFKRRKELESTQVLEYIREGEKLNYHKRCLTSHRKEWFWVEKRPPPHAMFTYMFRRKPRFIYNEAGIHVLNTLHCIQFREEIRKDTTMMKAVLAYLNSDQARTFLRQIARAYGGGLFKIEPKEVLRFPCLDVRRLSDFQREKLALLFNRLCRASRDGKEAEVQARLSKIVNSITI